MSSYDSPFAQHVRLMMAKMREDVDAMVWGIPHSGLFREPARGPGHDITAFGGSARIVDAGEQRCLPSSR